MNEFLFQVSVTIYHQNSNFYFDIKILYSFLNCHSTLESVSQIGFVAYKHFIINLIFETGFGIIF